MQVGTISRDARILIVGAGAAGLCTAWYLKLAGFRHVKVFEQSPRLGGKCRSVTVDGESFDLGANYVTSAYARVRELAAHVGATLYTEKAGHVIDVRTGAMRSILSEVLRRTPLPTLLWQSLRYLWKRWRLRRLLTPYQPGFAHVKDCPELQGNFADWLRRHRLDALIEIFEIPLTLMGYGKLDGIAAAYALTYMSPQTFMNLSMFAANVPLRSWPRRFTQGYGRMFERLAAEVDVLTGVRIEKITRGDTIEVEYWLLEQQLEGHERIRETATLRLPRARLPAADGAAGAIPRRQRRRTEVVRRGGFQPVLRDDLRGTGDRRHLRRHLLAARAGARPALRRNAPVSGQRLHLRVFARRPRR